MSKIFKSLFSEEERTVQFKTRTEGRKKNDQILVVIFITEPMFTFFAYIYNFLVSIVNYAAELWG